jgi:hypothetical protein
MLFMRVRCVLVDVAPSPTHMPPPSFCHTRASTRVDFKHIDKNTPGLVGAKKGKGSNGAGGGGARPANLLTARGPLQVPAELRAAAEAAGLKLELPGTGGGSGGGGGEEEEEDDGFKAALAASTAAEDTAADARASVPPPGEMIEETVKWGAPSFFPPDGVRTRHSLSPPPPIPLLHHLLLFCTSRYGRYRYMSCSAVSLC